MKHPQFDPRNAGPDGRNVVRYAPFEYLTTVEDHDIYRDCSGDLLLVWGDPSRDKGDRGDIGRGSETWAFRTRYGFGPPGRWPEDVDAFIVAYYELTS